MEKRPVRAVRTSGGRVSIDATNGLSVFNERDELLVSFSGRASDYRIWAAKLKKVSDEVESKCAAD